MANEQLKINGSPRIDIGTCSDPNLVFQQLADMLRVMGNPALDSGVTDDGIPVSPVYEAEVTLDENFADVAGNNEATGSILDADGNDSGQNIEIRDNTAAIGSGSGTTIRVLVTINNIVTNINDDSVIIVNQVYGSSVTAGCGIVDPIVGGVVTVDNADLAGLGLVAGADCVLDVVLTGGCGITANVAADEITVGVDNDDLAGDYLTAGDDCILHVDDRTLTVVSSIESLDISGGTLRIGYKTIEIIPLFNETTASATLYKTISVTEC